MAFYKKFNWLIFFFVFVSLSFLTAFSFLAVWGRDEGTLGNGYFSNLFADLFSFFRFPTHYLLGDYINENFFYPGLLINCILYSYLTERILFLFNKEKRHQVNI